MPTLRLSAELSQLCAIREFVSRTSRDLGVSERVMQDLLLVVDEICSNVIVHGYDGHGGEIEVTVDRSEEEVRAIVRDWGKEFDPEAICVPDIDAPLQQRPCGGLGLFIVRQLMDEVRFEFEGEKGNSVTMVKRLRHEAEQQPA